MYKNISKNKHTQLGYYLSYNFDDLAREIILLKEGKVNKWNQIVKKTNIIGNIDYIVRVLGSREEYYSKNNNPLLDEIANILASKLSTEIITDLLMKELTISQRTCYDKISRYNNIFNKYISISNILKQNSSILIIDDVRTTGYTLDEVKKSIRESYPKINIYTFSLVQTEDCSESLFLTNMNLFTNIKEDTNYQIKIGFLKTLNLDVCSDLINIYKEIESIAPISQNISKDVFSNIELLIKYNIIISQIFEIDLIKYDNYLKKNKLLLVKYNKRLILLFSNNLEVLFYLIGSIKLEYSFQKHYYKKKDL